MQKYIELIKQYSKRNYLKMIREPKGLLKYPFIVPGSDSYADNLWDWDSWLTNVAIRQIMKDNEDNDLEFYSYEKGCILNFIEHAKEDGGIPIFITPEYTFPEMLNKTGKTNIHKPCLIQHAAFVVKETNENAEWLKPYLEKLEKFLEHYKNHMYHKDTGLYFWIDDCAIGVDNDPSIYYRPEKSCASIYLNCLMYKELLAFSYIMKLLGKSSEKYELEAEQLKSAIQEHLWDERNGMYYSADLNLRPIDSEEWLHSGMPRHWNCVIERIDSWCGFMALWAGIATEEQAKRMVYENMMEKRLFHSEFGICTLAKTEKMYCVVKSGNPSCWLGPIWGISNYMCYRGLKKYGFEKEAKSLIHKTVSLFGKDIKESGELHEYYNPETGAGVNNPGFQNWNLLVNNMIADWEKREQVVEF